MADWLQMPYKYENATPNFTLFNHCPPNRRSPCEFGHRLQKKKKRKKNIIKKCARDIIHHRLPRAHLKQLKSLRPKFNSIWMIIIWAHRTDIPGGESSLSSFPLYFIHAIDNTTFETTKFLQKDQSNPDAMTSSEIPNPPKKGETRNSSRKSND